MTHLIDHIAGGTGFTACGRYAHPDDIVKENPSCGNCQRLSEFRARARARAAVERATRKRTPRPRLPIARTR